MDTFKLVSQITKEVFDDEELDAKFNEDPIALVKTYAEELTDEEAKDIAKQIAERLVIWGRNTGVASSLE